jgi:hypothetical protein
MRRGAETQLTHEIRKAHAPQFGQLRHRLQPPGGPDLDLVNQADQLSVFRVGECPGVPLAFQGVVSCPRRLRQPLIDPLQQLSFRAGEACRPPASRSQVPRPINRRGLPILLRRRSAT